MCLWIVLVSISLVDGSIDCALSPILKGVSTKQSLGETQRKLFPSEPDCKGRCLAETSFNCTAILWGGDATSDCYIYDKVDLSQEIFVDQRVFLLYVSVCDGEPTPSIGYCQFLLNQTGVTAPTGLQSVSPGMSTESSCREFCIAGYWGQNCNAFVVSSDRASTCTLYPANPPLPLVTGPQNLWTKNCFPPPKNCEYSTWTEWSTCTVSCGNGTRTRSRNVVSQGSDNGIQCMDSEKNQIGSCGTQACNSGCIYSEWTAFGDCNATCSSNGVRNRTRSIAQGSTCSSMEMIDYKTCASTIECGRSCIYTSWTEWTACSLTCTTSRSRTLEMGDSSSCEIEYGPLNNSIICEGGACNFATTTPGLDNGAMTTPSTNSGGNNNSGGNPTTGGANIGGNTGTTRGTSGGSVKEPGCKIPSIDPSVKVSSQGYKAVGARQDCAAMCLQETAFKCGAYITTGPGGVCVLQGTLDRPITVLTNSRFYLQDVNCVTSGESFPHSKHLSGSTSPGVCSWQSVGKLAGNGTFSIPPGFVSIGLTIDASHCSTLCMMNWPIYRPNPCVAYAWNPLIPFESGRDNCFMYNVDALSNLNTGDFELFRLTCP